MKNKKINKKSKKILMIVGIILIVIIIILNIITNNLKKVPDNNKEQETISLNGFKTIEDVFKYYGCQYIKETKSKDKAFVKDFYVKFKYNTFEGEESNKRYYENVISISSQFVNGSFRILDESKNLVIEIIKVNQKGIVSCTYKINGEADYFDKRTSKIELKNHEEVKKTTMEINSIHLNQIKENKWDRSKVDLGSKDSSFDNYDIYFDEGMEVRTISGKVYNIIFTKKYLNEVVSGIKVGTEFNEIISKLGNPTFGFKDGDYIGYKDSEIYVFFFKDKISIYKYNEKTDMEEFDELLTKYVNKKIDIKKFMNELTYLWPDYEEYKYNSKYIYINYPIQGIRIEMDSDTPLGIEIYKNCNITENISKLIEEGKITSRIKYDLNEETLKEREQKINDEYIYISQLLVSGEERQNLISNLYYSYLFKDNGIITKVLFISKNEEIPNTEFKEKINQGFFINDETFVYSIKNKGIYALNVINKNITEIITGKENFELKGYKDNLLKYDEEQTININVE